LIFHYFEGNLSFVLQAKTSDTVFQAKNLVKRMRSDSKVDMKNHWKLVTYFIGAIDFCTEICITDDQDKVIEVGAQNLRLALRILQKHLPRTIVNVVLPPNVVVTTQLTDKPFDCVTYNYAECPCFYSLIHQKDRKRSMNTIQR
jgi:hypothetical protein